MRIGITGGTGFIGTPLCRRLIRDGHRLTLFGRNQRRVETAVPEAEFKEWDAVSVFQDLSALEGFDAFVHLAGEPIAAGRWSVKRKKLIADSRILGTRNLVQGFRQCRKPPGVFISSSAIGYYGTGQTEEFVEDSPPGEGFLSEVAVRWEEEARPVVDIGSRLVSLRTGVVLSTKGGALSRMLLPFRFGIGGRLGTGHQSISWIHLDDQIRLIRFALMSPTLKGPLNATAPIPVTNLEFTRELGRVLNRPTILPVPSLVLKFVLGEMAEALLLRGQRVLPKKAIGAGFKFRFSTLSEALSDLLG